MQIMEDVTQIAQAAPGPQETFTPRPRHPLDIPTEEITVPLPPAAPSPPPPFNWWMSVLPPLLMIGASVGVSVYMASDSWMMMLPMLLAGGMFPVFNVINMWSQRRRYEEAVQAREKKFKAQLQEVQHRLDAAVQQEREELLRYYPDVGLLKEIATQKGSLLWSRRPQDEDFLHLRVGLREASPSFTVSFSASPNVTEDPLVKEAEQIATAYKKVAEVPALIPLASEGSLIITADEREEIYQVAYRLLVDLLVHHSPLDVRLAVVASNKERYRWAWEWLKWTPHSGMLQKGQLVPTLAFTPRQVSELLLFLKKEMAYRQEQASGAPEDRDNLGPTWVLIVDGTAYRERSEILQITREGYKVGLFVIFIGERGAPRACRSRLEVHSGGGDFYFAETHGVKGEQFSGQYEGASREEAEFVARALARLKAVSEAAAVPLPTKVALSEVLQRVAPLDDEGHSAGIALMSESIRSRWQYVARRADEKITPLLRFPFGLQAGQEDLEVVELNLLPAERGGEDAYHTVLIGTTGSGKSEFLKTLVLAAAAAYPPQYLNFFFLDFKGGAAFDSFQRLPHTTGVVTNLSPHLVERGLDAIQNEIDRRQAEFQNNRANDIWRYNRGRSQDALMPHLVLFLDEFARGLEEFPRLQGVLDTLVRQGRSLGMYLVLANQDVNAYVDKLLNNIGWRIALKVAKPEDLSAIIERGRDNPERAGQGYLRSLTGQVIPFQAGYSGAPLQEESAHQDEAITIYRFTSQGYELLYDAAAESRQQREEVPMSEGERLLEIIPQVAQELHLRPAAQIYQPPLPEKVELDGLLRAAAGGKGALEAVLGMLDQPHERRQMPLRFDLADRDGHLWIVGIAGSGTEMAVHTLLTSIAHRYTPEQAQFYIVDLGAGEMAPLKALPHTGALITPLRSETEVERLQRLMAYLDNELQRRGHILAREGSLNEPALVVVLHNYAEFHAGFPDEEDTVRRLAQGGKRAKIHLVFTTNRGGELWGPLASMITRRLVLQQGNRDEYVNLAGRQARPLPPVRGRGYWVVANEIVGECQVATLPPKAMEAVRWEGHRPRAIEILPKCRSLAWFQRQREAGRVCPGGEGEACIPVGQDYDDLRAVTFPLEDNPYWLVVGPRESGRSNFLGAALETLLRSTSPEWRFEVFAFRRGLLAKRLAEVQDERLHLFRSPQEIQDRLKALVEEISRWPETHHALLVFDDLDFGYQRTELKMALDKLAFPLEAHPHVYLLASGLDNMKSFGAKVIEILKQGRTGIAFSKEAATNVLGVSRLSPNQRRQEFLLGRGFLVHKGVVRVVQTFKWGTCAEE